MPSTCWRCKGDLVDIGHGLQCMNNCPPAPLSSKNQLTVAELLAELEKWDDSPDGPAWVARAAILEIERLRADVSYWMSCSAKACARESALRAVLAMWGWY